MEPTPRNMKDNPITRDLFNLEHISVISSTVGVPVAS